MKALVVEDDRQLRSQLMQGLKSIELDVHAAQDGNEGLHTAQAQNFDFAVIDLGLPKLDGIELIKRLRTEGADFPILILTARGGWQAKVEGLEAGADDYMEKPFQMEELQARAKALLRRMKGHNSLITMGPLKLDHVTQAVTLNEDPVDLTAFEYKILEFMMRRPGEVISKSVLTDHLYEQDFDRDSNVIEVLMGRLRKKIHAVEGFSPIVTLRGRGYQLKWDDPC